MASVRYQIQIMSTKQATDWRELRRLRAWDLKNKGWKQRDIAEALGVTEGAVSQWLKRGREKGEKALAARKHPGRKAQLSKQQKQQIPALLAKGCRSVWISWRCVESPSGGGGFAA